jgi:hypothetical protein
MKLNIDYQRLQLYDAILDAVLESGASAVTIAGGAIRDMLLERPIKDIDVLYTMPKVEKTEPNGWLAWDEYKEIDEEIIKKYFTYGQKTAADYEDDTFTITHPHLIWKDDLTNTQIQLIFVQNDPDEYVQEFPCTLSRVAYGNELSISNEFMYAAENQLLVFTDDCSETYQEKMYAKYPEFL